MKQLTTEKIQRLVPYPPGKPIEELERELGIMGSIKLASNENPIGPSPMAVKAIMDNLNRLNRYPDGSSYYLKEKLSQVFNLPMEMILIGNGSNELIELAIRTFLVPGQEVIQPFPTFLVYEKVVNGAGGELVSVDLRDFRIDLDAVKKAITSKTKLIFINNPNNPTGTGLSKEEIKGFLKWVPEDIVIVIDEAYVEFASEKVARGTDLLDVHERLIVLRTFSKLYGLAGLRIGYGFSSPEIVDYINRVRQPFNANLLAQTAAVAALDDADFVKKTLDLTREGLKYLFEKLDEMGLSYVPTETNFFLIRVPSGAKNIYHLMLKEGVIVRSMESYGLKEYIRVNVGLSSENERFINTLKKVIHSL
ncbi:MAG: histidinol-phosphate transaminase [Deltaproteobacteria bacterium]|nr:histidinol-phosphate transaminase [Deltaproteobacteria bacterium]